MTVFLQGDNEMVYVPFISANKGRITSTVLLMVTSQGATLQPIQQARFTVLALTCAPLLGIPLQ